MHFPNYLLCIFPPLEHHREIAEAGTSKCFGSWVSCLSSCPSSIPLLYLSVTIFLSSSIHTGNYQQTSYYYLLLLISLMCYSSKQGIWEKNTTSRYDGAVDGWSVLPMKSWVSIRVKSKGIQEVQKKGGQTGITSRTKTIFQRCAEDLQLTPSVT